MATPNPDRSVALGKKMKRAAAMIPDDVLLEILFRVSTDVADLFRCAVTCKGWCALVADPSFLRRRWPENACHPFSLLGFFVQQPRPQYDIAELGVGNVDINSPPPFFVPAQQHRSPLGARHRFLTSFATGVTAGLLDGAEPLTARCGLLLVRLARGSDNEKTSVHLAVCDPLAGTCDMLPPLNCPVSHISCAILTGSDYCSSNAMRRKTSTPDYSILAVVQYNYGWQRHDCDLYTFSSAKPSWSRPRSCFNQTLLYNKQDGFLMPVWSRSGVVYRGMTYWFAVYMSSDMKPLKFYTFNVSIETSHISLTELSIPTDPLRRRDYGWPMLSLAGSERALQIFDGYPNDGLLRLEIWGQMGDNVSETETVWLQVGTFDLKTPKEIGLRGMIRVWSGEKSGTLFILLCMSSSRVHTLDVQTGEMKDVTGLFGRGLNILAVPMEIDWPTLFMSRLGGHICL